MHAKLPVLICFSNCFISETDFMLTSISYDRRDSYCFQPSVLGRNMIVVSYTKSHFSQFVLCWPLEIGDTSRVTCWLLRIHFFLPRLLWLLLIIACLSLLINVLAKRLLLYFDYTSKINVEITYEDKLPFPAVTVCNQNLFRQVQCTLDTSRKLASMLHGLPLCWLKLSLTLHLCQCSAV